MVSIEARNSEVGKLGSGPEGVLKKRKRLGREGIIGYEESVGREERSL
jgi:hypothetical protein